MYYSMRLAGNDKVQKSICNIYDWQGVNIPNESYELTNCITWKRQCNRKIARMYKGLREKTMFTWPRNVWKKKKMPNSTSSEENENENIRSFHPLDWKKFERAIIRAQVRM